MYKKGWKEAFFGWHSQAWSYIWHCNPKHCSHDFGWRFWCVDCGVACPLSSHLGLEITLRLQEPPTSSSWQSYTYCNHDKIKVIKQYRFTYTQWKHEYTSLEQLTLPTLILTFWKINHRQLPGYENSALLVSYSVCLNNVSISVLNLRFESQDRLSEVWYRHWDVVTLSLWLGPLLS